jgi:hypothetical protein
MQSAIIYYFLMAVTASASTYIHNYQIKMTCPQVSFMLAMMTATAKATAILATNFAAASSGVLPKQGG